MALTVNPEAFKFASEFAAGVKGKRVFITGAGKDLGIGQAFALACALNGAASVGVHFHSSYEDALATVELINANGGNAFPVQADVTNTSELWSIRSYVIDKMGGLPPNLVICNSGLSERGYVLGRPLKEVEGESRAERRSRARRAFVQNLEESSKVMTVKFDGFLFLTHLWAGEALYFNEPLQLVYISSRQAVDPGAGVPGYVMANFGVIALPKILRINLGRSGALVRAFSVAYPFVRTGMTKAYAENEKVFGRWQPRMLESNEAALALLQLLGRPAEELDDRIYQLNVEASADGESTEVTWSDVRFDPSIAALDWSTASKLVLPKSAS